MIRVTELDTYYSRHRQERLDYAKRYRQGHTAKINRYQFSYRLSHKHTRQIWARERRAEIKATVLLHYGNGKIACVQCGYDANVNALSIDHIKGNGKEHRSSVNIHGGLSFYIWLINNNFPKGYQTLCMNCQFIKKIANKEMGKAQDKEQLQSAINKEQYLPQLPLLDILE